MRFTKTRWGYYKNRLGKPPQVEEATFIARGTENISWDDPRITKVDNQYGLLISISNPFYDLPQLPRQMTKQKRANPATGNIEEIAVPGPVIKNQEYWQSEYWHPYNNPIREGLVSVGEDEYLELKSQYIKEVEERRQQQREMAKKIDSNNRGRVKSGSGLVR